MQAETSEGPQRKPVGPTKRLYGACAFCRKRKIKCDRPVNSGKTCSNCQLADIECVRPEHGPNKRDRQREYIRALEERNRTLEERNRVLEERVQQLLPNSGSRGGPSPHNSLPSEVASTMPTPLSSMEPLEDSPAFAVSEDKGSESDDSDDLDDLTAKLGRLFVHNHHDRFFGKSSILGLVTQVITASNDSGSGLPSATSVSAIKRLGHWGLQPWEVDYVNTPEEAYTYPEPDLLGTLLNAFRERVYSILPVVHWPSFVRDVRRGRHLADPAFGAVLLAVCATASRCCDDPRVFVSCPGTPEALGVSAGWRFISQVPMYRRAMFKTSTIEDLQFYVLAAFYILGTSVPPTALKLIGLAMRICTEKGMHRRREPVPHIKTKEQEELEKRIFWSLLMIERVSIIATGQVSCIRDDDIDVDFPLEVDDEYWGSEVDDPSQAFVQPPGKPSVVSVLVTRIKLWRIAAFMVQTLYSTRKAHMLSGPIRDQWEVRVATELDSSMNQWKDGLPAHLRWDSAASNSANFLDQVIIHSEACLVQILIHRPFLRKKSSHSMTALTICTNAARTMSRIADAAVKGGIRFFVLQNFSAAIAAAMVLAMNALGDRDKLPPRRYQTDIEQLLGLLKVGQKRWCIAGRFVDIIETCILRIWQSTPSSADSDPRSWAERQSPAVRSEANSLGQAYPAFDEPFLSGPYSNPVPGGSEYGTGNPPVDAPVLNWNDQLDSLLLFADLGFPHGAAAAAASTSPPHATGGQLHRQNDGYHQPQNVDIFADIFGDSATGPTTSDAAGGERLDVDMSTMAIWQGAPTAFSIEEWNMYLATLNLNQNAGAFV